jgi:hypothetical protein
MSNDPMQNLLDQIKTEFEDLNRNTRGSLERMRSVIYRNKKDLEGPIFSNKLRLDSLQKSSRWVWVLVAVQLALLGWLIATNMELKKQVSVLTQGVHDFETQTIKDLQRVEGAVDHIKRADDR